MTRSSLGPSLKINVDTLAAILVTLTPLVYFNAALLGKISLASEDGILFNVPLRVAAASIMRGGSLPLWNPYLFSGMPLHAAAQGGLLFPLNWFYLFFDAPAATNLMALSTYMLAALGAYLFARRSGSSPAGAIVTSLIWQACGFMIGQFSHINIVQTAALLPWLLCAVDGFGARGDRRWALGIAVIVMLQAFAGHQQTLVYSLLLATAYAVVMWHATKPARNWYLWSLVLLAAGMLLAAVQILPTYELMRNSLRSRASFDFFTAFSLPPKFLFTFFAPYLMGGGDGRLFRVTYFGAPFYGEFIAYVGLGALMLAVFAVMLKRDTRTKFWTAVVVIAFLLALGRHWPFKLYAVIYYVPILNLFRVPARHMLELDLALAVLAGRGLTTLAALNDRKRATRLALTVGGSVVLITFLVVTVGRPATFQVSRAISVTLLRAPELFLPVFFALLSAGTLYWYARSRRAIALSIFVGVLILDLWVWGQSSGWRIASPPPDSPVWNEPPPVKLLPRDGQYRILTAPHPFDPNKQVVGPLTSRSTDWVLWLQPDLYMMHGIENAAGYDGFGMARYSRFAGDMTVWGELPNPDQTLRGPGREFDLLNVKYLLAMSSLESDEESSSSSSSSAQPSSSERASPLVGASADRTSPLTATEARMLMAQSSTLPMATRVIAGERFAIKDLNVPSINKSSSLVFQVPLVPTNRIALLTNLSWSADLPNGTPVARVHLTAEDGRTFDFDLRTGEHTSEWSYDRPDIRRRIKHSRARVGTSYKVGDAQARYQGHTYISVFTLPEPAPIISGEIMVLSTEVAPDLSLTVRGISLSGRDVLFAFESEWIFKQASDDKGDGPSERWVRVGETELVTVFENTRVLPRAWLAPAFEVLNGEQILQTIRTGSLPNENVWDSRRTVLVEAPVELGDAASNRSSGDVASDGSATVLEHQPNRVQLRTVSAAPSILVLSENFYPGWRAYVDGRSAEILRVNYNQRGLVLGPGEHVVEFVYRPYSVLIGLVISVLTLASLGLGTRRVASQ